MRRLKNSATPSLFDEASATEQLADVTDLLTEKSEIGNTEEELDDWVDVPQARFLSWSSKEQMHYCWRRDLDSALRALNDNEASFYLTRAAMYKSAYDESIPQDGKSAVADHRPA